MSKPLKVFVTYARKDMEAKDKFITSLVVMKRQGLIDIWHDNEMLGGDRWQEEIFSTHLPTSDLLLYLVKKKMEYMVRTYAKIVDPDSEKH